jgi:hypothetical protein
MRTKRYRAIEDGEKAPTLDELIAIARITGKTLDFLITGAARIAA